MRRGLPVARHEGLRPASRAERVEKLFFPDLTKLSKQKELSKSKKSKRRPKRAPVSMAAVKMAAMEDCSIVAAGVRLAETAKSFEGDLAALFEGHPKLRAAWDTGRFLARVREMTVSGVRNEAIARELGIRPEDFESRLNADVELNEIYRDAKIRRQVAVSEGVTKAAFRGQKHALDEILREFESGGGSASVDYHRMQIKPEAAEFFGVSHVAIYDWKKKGCPGIGGGILDAPVVVAWLRNLAFAKSAATEGDDSDIRLREERIQKLRMENDHRRARLVETTAVVATRIADATAYIESLQRLGRAIIAYAADGQTPRERREMQRAIDGLIGEERREILDTMKRRNPLPDTVGGKVRTFLDELFPTEEPEELSEEDIEAVDVDEADDETGGGK